MNHLIPDLSKVDHKQLKYLKRQKIMIGTPMYGGAVMGNYELSISATLHWAGALGITVKPEYLFGATYLELGRNYIANAFWHSDFTHLVFVDADNGFAPNHLFELILCTAEGRHIVGGLYPRRKINWKAVHAAVLAGVKPEFLSHCAGDFPMHPLAGHDITIGHEPQKVLSMPTGFLCITRHAFQKYVEAWPERRTTPGNPGHFGIEFFRAGVQEINGSRGFDTEDNLFCKDLLTLGINTWFCPWMSISHYGSELHEACYACSNGHYVHDIREKPALYSV